MELFLFVGAVLEEGLEGARLLLELGLDVVVDGVVVLVDHVQDVVVGGRDELELALEKPVYLYALRIGTDAYDRLTDKGVKIIFPEIA